MVSEVIWSSHWLRAHRFALQEAVSQKRTVTGRDKLAAPACSGTTNPCVTAPNRAGGTRGTWNALTGAALPIPAHGHSFLTPYLCMYNHKSHWNSLMWVPSSPAQGCEDEALNVLNILKRKVCAHIRWCRSCDRCWVINAHHCNGVLRGREGVRVCLAGAGAEAVRSQLWTWRICYEPKFSKI